MQTDKEESIDLDQNEEPRRSSLDDEDIRPSLVEFSTDLKVKSPSVLNIKKQATDKITLITFALAGIYAISQLIMFIATILVVSGPQIDLFIIYVITMFSSVFGMITAVVGVLSAISRFSKLSQKTISLYYVVSMVIILLIQGMSTLLATNDWLMYIAVLLSIPTLCFAGFRYYLLRKELPNT
jgi:hypothetical protein